MNKCILGLALIGCLLTGKIAAGTTDAYFDSATGKIVIPHFVFNNQTYYLTLTLADPAKLSFSADLESVTALTPPSVVGNTVNLTMSDIVGTWAFPNSNSTMAFFSDGNYQVNQAGNEDPNCNTGGLETGTY